MATVAHKARTSVLKRRNRELIALQEQREEARAELGRAYDRLRSLTHRLEAAKEEERKRIARELHDEMGQALTAIKINLKLPRDETGASPEWVLQTVGLVDELIDRVRDLSLDLSPPLLEGQR